MTVTSQTLSFVKYQGAGNDFILLSEVASLPASHTTQLCSRQYGVGSDGVVCVTRESETVLTMRIFNADGSEATMCGNALRCVAHHTFSQNPGLEKALTICLGGKKYLCSKVDKGIRVELPLPALKHRGPCLEGVGDWIDTGTDHLVIEVDREELSSGSFSSTCQPLSLEKSAYALEGVNVNWTYLVNSRHIQMRTFEKGVNGETFACGSGAAAAVYAYILRGLINSSVCVEFVTSKEKLWFEVSLDDKGSLKAWSMIGKAIPVFTGSIEL